MADLQRRIRYLYRKTLRSVQPSFYLTAMRLRRLRNEGEIEAIVPFETRILLQHGPKVGRDGFLFHRDHDALDQLSAAIVLRPRQIRTWVEALEMRLEWCARNEAAMRFLIIPEKHVVYADKLPRFTRVSPSRPAQQVLDALDEPLARRTLYPIDALKAASKVKLTYFKTDTHWNAHGAFAAYRALSESLAPEIELETVGEEALRWKDRPFVGDLGVRFHKERGEIRSIAEPTASYRLSFQNHNFGRGAVHIYENERRDLPTCVLFRDSFSNFLIPYLMQGFSRLVAVSSLSCHYDLLDQEKPDVVLFVCIERFLATFGRGQIIELPEDAARHSFADFTGTSLAEIAPSLKAQLVLQSSFEAFVSSMPPLVLGDPGP